METFSLTTSVLRFTGFVLCAIGIVGCAPGNDPFYSPGGYGYGAGSGPYYGGSPYGYGYGNGGYRDDYYNQRERERLQDERDRLERERRRLEREQYQRPYQPPYQPPPPSRPAPSQDRCPAGFSPSEQKCSQAERSRGCRDIRLPSGLGCVSR